MRAVERPALAAYAWLAAVLAGTAAAQSQDAPRAPRIIGAPTTTAPAGAAVPPATAPLPPTGMRLRPPNAARLAPLPEERGDIEEIIIVGQGWRLPDLGSAWRARQEEAARSGRFSATALPLYDPANPPARIESFAVSAEQRRHGVIDLFRLRFGRRTSE
jgi:hypothetical protein